MVAIFCITHGDARIGNGTFLSDSGRIETWDLESRRRKHAAPVIAIEGSWGDSGQQSQMFMMLGL